MSKWGNFPAVIDGKTSWPSVLCWGNLGGNLGLLALVIYLLDNLFLFEQSGLFYLIRYTLKDRHILPECWMLFIGKFRRSNLLFILKTGCFPTPFPLLLPDIILSLHYCFCLIIHSSYITPPLREGMGNYCILSPALCNLVR